MQIKKKLIFIPIFDENISQKCTASLLFLVLNMRRLAWLSADSRTNQKIRVSLITVYFGFLPKIDFFP